MGSSNVVIPFLALVGAVLGAWVARFFGAEPLLGGKIGVLMALALGAGLMLWRWRRRAAARAERKPEG